MCEQCGYILRLHLRAHNNYRHCVTKEHMTLSEATSQGQTHPAKPRDDCSKTSPRTTRCNVDRSAKEKQPKYTHFQKLSSLLYNTIQYGYKKITKDCKKKTFKNTGDFFFGTTELKETAKCQGICNQNAASREAHSKSFRGRKVGLCFFIKKYPSVAARHMSNS